MAFGVGWPFDRSEGVGGIECLEDLGAHGEMFFVLGVLVL